MARNEDGNHNAAPQNDAHRPNGHSNDNKGHNGHSNHHDLAAAASSDAHHENRWQGIDRRYSDDDVLKIRGSVKIEHTLAKLGAERLWQLMHDEPYVNALGAITGNQAIEMVQAGLQAIYASGNLPAAGVDGLQASLDHFDGLVPGDCAEGVDGR